MQLISLTANRDSFKPVVFNSATGINIIVAKQKNPEKSDKGDTTNGVGKSLLIAIIHFCLGSSSKKAFKDSLSGWEFTLKFRIKNLEYTSIRSTDKQSKIRLNGEEITTREFNGKLKKLVFEIPDDIGELSFRSLIPFFIRPTKASYNDERNPKAVNKPFQVQMINAYLLGLDVLLAQEKYHLKLEKDRIKDLVKNLKNDNYLKDFFTGKKDVSLSKQELSDKIDQLEYNLKNFNVAEDYYDIKQQADQLKQDIERLHQQLELIKIQISNIDESRKISPDIERNKIEQVYKEASVLLQDQAIKQLAELEKFYEHLSRNREKRLLDQKNELLRKAKLFEITKHSKSAELDGKLKYLDAHQALDMFTKLSNNLSDLKSKKENLEQYEELLESYSEESRKISKLQLDESEKTAIYLKDASEVIARTNDFFRTLVKRFYPKAAAGITIHNNEGENQIRFDIDAKIEFDKSDGISNVKTFCYDMTLLLKGYGHNVDFIFHDSRLLEGIDPRQKFDLITILKEYIEGSSKQYIITVNYNQLEEIKPLFQSEDDYYKFVKENTILELKDSSASDKLLGIQVDMDYE
ncbi:DUF2326 domain-containing protein [Carboxylicivirga caseinilyticus]|uniref:DUF2326 domain-containing protein n=1 Tax=Carboxylicivirga caseinilyticus TaxID=3417572 RepID=UPI003D342F8D|nr:DUF2326 domain-containing protein [Marinilabiliaceae bacterium A049]